MKYYLLIHHAILSIIGGFFYRHYSFLMRYFDIIYIAQLIIVYILDKKEKKVVIINSQERIILDTFTVVQLIELFKINGLKEKPVNQDIYIVSEFKKCVYLRQSVIKVIDDLLEILPNLKINIILRDKKYINNVKKFLKLLQHPDRIIVKYSHNTDELNINCLTYGNHLKTRLSTVTTLKDEENCYANAAIIDSNYKECGSQKHLGELMQQLFKNSEYTLFDGTSFNDNPTMVTGLELVTDIVNDINSSYINYKSNYQDPINEFDIFDNELVFHKNNIVIA